GDVARAAGAEAAADVAAAGVVVDRARRGSWVLVTGSATLVSGRVSSIWAGGGAAGLDGSNHSATSCRLRSSCASGSTPTCASKSSGSRLLSMTLPTGTPAGNTPPRPEVISWSPAFTSVVAGR